MLGLLTSLPVCTGLLVQPATREPMPPTCTAGPQEQPEGGPHTGCTGSSAGCDSDPLRQGANLLWKGLECRSSELREGGLLEWASVLLGILSLPLLQQGLEACCLTRLCG